MVLFFFNDTATTEIYTLSLHDALPISGFEVGNQFGRQLAVIGRHLQVLVRVAHGLDQHALVRIAGDDDRAVVTTDRKSTRLNSSHQIISYAVFCLKKKNILTTALSHAS